MSQSALARAIGKTAGTIWQIEKDKYPNVRSDTLIAIAGVLDANPDWIASGRGTPYKLDAKDSMKSRINTELDDLSPEHQASVLAFIATIKQVR